MADDQEQLNAERITAPLEQPTKPATFKVKLTRKPGKPDKRITLFSFVDGDRIDHFDTSSGDEFEKEFDDLNKAHGFITAALGTGGFTVAQDSPVKLSE